MALKSMQIRINGNSHELAAPVTATALLESLGLAGKPVVVEIDENAIFPRDYPHTEIGEGARVEIVTLAAGG